MWFVGKRGSENAKWAREAEKGGTPADIDNELGNGRNEKSQRMFVHNTSFMRDKLVNQTAQQVNATIINCFDEKYFLN